MKVMFSVSTGFVGSDITEELEFPDDYTEEDI